MEQFTHTQQAILKMLSDGQRHHRDHLLCCFSDELASVQSLKNQLTAIRKQIRPLGEEIICETANRRTYYRHVRLLSSFKPV